MRAAILDIETATLDVVAPGAAFYCAVFKPIGSHKIIVHRHDQNGQRAALKATLNTLAQFDLIIGHNVQRFDLPMLFSFMRVNGLKGEYPNPLVYDTLAAFRRIGYCTPYGEYGRIKKLGFCIDFFWPGEQKKTSLFPHWHAMAIYNKGEAGKRAMTYVVNHCIADVMMNEKLYLKMLPDDQRVNIRRFR